MSMLPKVWGKWLKVAHVIGNIQMVIALSLVYWLLLAPMAVILKLVSDPLALRHRGRARWEHRPSPPNVLDAIKNQF